MPVKKKLSVLDEPARFIRTLHPEIKRKIKAALAEILASPSKEGKALRDGLKGLRRFRVGKIRIVYRLTKNVIEIVSIGPRKTIYEETYRLLKRKR